MRRLLWKWDLLLIDEFPLLTGLDSCHACLSLALPAFRLNHAVAGISPLSAICSCNSCNFRNPVMNSFEQIPSKATKKMRLDASFFLHCLFCIATPFGLISHVPFIARASSPSHQFGMTPFGGVHPERIEGFRVTRIKCLTFRSRLRSTLIIDVRAKPRTISFISHDLSPWAKPKGVTASTLTVLIESKCSA